MDNHGSGTASRSSSETLKPEAWGEETDEMLQSHEKQFDRRLRARRWPWQNFALSLSLAVNVIFAIVLWTSHVNHFHSQGSYETGFDSDFGGVLEEIEIVKKDYEGGVVTSDDGTRTLWYSQPDGPESPVRFMGDPSPEVDEAWDDLTSGLLIDYDDPNNEYGLEGRTFRWPNSDKYFMGLGVYHALHCLNRVRKALHQDYYPFEDHPGEPPIKMHTGHCIEHLRQSLLCHADLTPLYGRLTDASGDKLAFAAADLYETHTCRNFTRIHEWTRKRVTDFADQDAVSRAWAKGERFQLHGQ